MPIFREEKPIVIGTGYESDPIGQYVQEFANVIDNICVTESFDYYKNPAEAFYYPGSKDALRKFFVENSFDENDPDMRNPQMRQDKVDEMNALFENTIKAVQENTPIGVISPIQGITIPMYKNILMNSVFDKGAIPKAVAQTPQFTRTMENRYLIDTEGNKIDMFKDQRKMYWAMKNANPVKKVELSLTSGLGQYENLIRDNFNGSEKFDKLDVNTCICGVAFDNEFATGQIKPDGKAATGDETVETVFPTELNFLPGYGKEANRSFIEDLILNVHNKTSDKYEAKVVKIIGTIDENDKVTITTVPANIIKKVFLKGKLDASNARHKKCSVGWDQTTSLVRIGTSEAISTTVSPEEIKDYSALYSVNQLTKIMSLTKTAMVNYKNDDIKYELDESYALLPPEDKFFGKFDFAPREGYYADHINWRQLTFFDWLESQMSTMFQRLNDPNMTVSVFGDPDLVRKIQPVEVQYTTPANIGSVELDFSRVAYTNARRHYTFIGSDNMRGEDQFIIVLCPRNTNRITYIIYDYQMYFGNEIRQADNPALPALHAFQRYKFDKYQPLQARIQILNPSGMRPSESENQAFREYTTPPLPTI